MTRDHFLNSLSLLRKGFNNYALPDVTIDAIWEDLRGYDARDWFTGCKRILANERPTSYVPFPTADCMLHYLLDAQEQRRTREQIQEKATLEARMGAIPLPSETVEEAPYGHLICQCIAYHTQHRVYPVDLIETFMADHQQFLSTRADIRAFLVELMMKPKAGPNRMATTMISTEEAEEEGKDAYKDARGCAPSLSGMLPEEAIRIIRGPMAVGKTEQVEAVENPPDPVEVGGPQVRQLTEPKPQAIDPVRPGASTDDDLNVEEREEVPSPVSKPPLPPTLEANPKYQGRWILLSRPNAEGMQDLLALGDSMGEMLAAAETQHLISPLIYLVPIPVKDVPVPTMDVGPQHEKASHEELLPSQVALRKYGEQKRAAREKR